MPEVVFQVVALGFQRVIVFFSNGCARIAQSLYRLVGDPVVGGKGILIELFAIARHREFATQLTSRASSSSAPLIAVGIGFLVFPSSVGARRSVKQCLQMLIQRFVRVRQADQDEVERLVQQGLTQRFVTIEVIAQEDREPVGNDTSGRESSTSVLPPHHSPALCVHLAAQ